MTAEKHAPTTVGPEEIEPSTRGSKVRLGTGGRADSHRSEHSLCWDETDERHRVAVSVAVIQR